MAGEKDPGTVLHGPESKQLGTTILRGPWFRRGDWPQKLGCGGNLLAGELVPNE